MSRINNDRVRREITELEIAVRAGRSAAIVDLLERILRGLDATESEWGRWCTDVADDGEAGAGFARLAAAISTFLTDPAVTIERMQYERLAVFLATIAQVFRVCGFRSADHVLETIAARSPGGAGAPIRFADKSEARKFLLAGSVFSERLDWFLSLLKIDPRSMVAPLLRMLSAHVIPDRLAHDNFQ